MISARTNTLANLRGRIERLEAPGDTHALNRMALGHAAADATLQGGLATGALHEVFTEGRQSGAATGFIAGLAGRLTARRH
jgi:protein ImuA